MAGEIEVRWTAGGHTFALTASLEGETLSVRLSMPAAFLAGADDVQRRAYGAARDRALDEVAEVLAMQREGEPHHITH